MLADPLRNVRLRVHGALLQGEVRRKRQMPFLTSVRREYGTNCDDQLDRIHAEFLHRLALDSITSYEMAGCEVSLDSMLNARNSIQIPIAPAVVRS